MAAIFRILRSRWLLTFLGAAIIALLVWFLLPPLGLDSVAVRLALALAVLLVWAAANLLADRRHHRRDAALAQGVAAAGARATAAAEEVAAIREKLPEALALLRRASGTRGYLYEQPWYVIIGPPGAGKTTALLNAGLHFPLAAEMGQGAVAGVGGTRRCDWWFTDQAVLIDTAGRYTTQDSDAAVDRAGWEAFLDLLRRARPRQPLNGVLVAIGISDLVQAGTAERLDHARAIRRRLRELAERLGLRLPVYLLFTKADLLAGFTEYFDDLDRSAREQVWGETFALDEGAPASRWSEAIGRLVGRLDARLIERLQAERSPERRAMLAGFPAQLASLETPLGEFIAEAFGGSRLDPAPRLRGVYFTSGTQAGTPIDRLTGALARGFGLDQARLDTLRPQQGRSYFLGGLLRLVFGEAMLASTRPGAGRRRTLRRAGAFAALGLATAGLALWLLSVRAAEQSDTARAAAALEAYSKLAAGVRLDPVTDDDLAPILPVLDAARDLPYGAAAPMPRAGLGLFQARKLASGARHLYRAALNDILLPRLLLRLERQMLENLERPELLYEATRIYLMLGGQGPLDPALVAEWEALDWRNRYQDPAMQANLAQHLASFLNGTLPDISLDWPLVANAQRAFSRISLASRVYSRIKPSAGAQALPPWTPAAALGGSGAQAFHRASGLPLTDGIAGFFTPDGFYRVLLPDLPGTAREVAGESWVLGQKAAIDSSPAAVAALQRDVVRLYTADYLAAWTAMLADLQVTNVGGGEAGMRALYILGSPDSPLRDLLVSIAHALSLSKPPAGIAAGESAAEKLAVASGGSGARLAKLLGNTAAAGPPPGQVIDNHFATLRAYVGDGPGAPLDVAIKLLADMQQQLAAGLSSGAGGAAPALAGGGDASQMLRAEAMRAPEPVRRWLETLAAGSSAARAGSAREAAAAAWGGSATGGGGGGGGGGSGGGAAAIVVAAAAGTPGGLCQAAVTGKYPFVQGSAAAIPIDDFARLFAPNGVLDSYFTAQIAPFVDKAGGVWRLRALNGVPPPISQADLAQFQRAAAIRDLFFGTGTLAVRFFIKPDFLDTAARRVTLDLGENTEIDYAFGPQRERSVTWPGGADGMNDVRLRFDPPPAAGTGVIEEHGAWALFRLIDRAAMSQGASADEFMLSFSAGERKAGFRLRAGSMLNPFAPGVLQGFRCPSG